MENMNLLNLIQLYWRGKHTTSVNYTAIKAQEPTYNVQKVII